MVRHLTIPLILTKKVDYLQQEIRRTVQIKLRHTPEQAEEIEKLFSAFKIGLNFSLKQIEEAYQKTMAKYKRVEEVDGVCAGCRKEKPLMFSSNRKLFCSSCVMREYSEYTVRGMSISTSQRPVANDIKTAVTVENQTHVHMMFSQAYGTWRSFNAWRNKREFERKRLADELSELKESGDNSYRAATEIRERAARLQREDKKITRLHAMAMASKEIYARYHIGYVPGTLGQKMATVSKERSGLSPDVSQRSIGRVVNKLRELNYKERPLHFPEYENVTAIQLHKTFVKFKGGKLHISLFHKKNNGQEIGFYSNEYLNQFLAEMEEDNAVYTNLIKRVDGKKVFYYLMYPLTVKREIPTVFDLADVFTICFSPDSVLVHSSNGEGEKYKVIRLGKMLNAKQHFQDKRAELMEHHTRNSLRRVKKMGNVERRTTRTANHQLSHEIIEYISGYLFSIDADGELENSLNQERVTDELKTGFQAGDILLSENTKVTKEKKYEWVLIDDGKKFILRKEQPDLISVYAYRSEQPVIVMWDMTSGITADYGRNLNRVKKMWPVVQQQEFIRHKASLRSIPVVMIQYNKQNVLTCSFCHSPFKKKDELGKPTKETVKTITALLHRVHNIKCEKCNHELNMLINQARNLSPLAKEPQKG